MKRYNLFLCLLCLPLQASYDRFKSNNLSLSFYGLFTKCLDLSNHRLKGSTLSYLLFFYLGPFKRVFQTTNSLFQILLAL